MLVVVFIFVIPILHGSSDLLVLVLMLTLLLLLLLQVLLLGAGVHGGAGVGAGVGDGEVHQAARHAVQLHHQLLSRQRVGGVARLGRRH